MRSKIWTILTVLLVFSLLVAACGGADEPAPAAAEPTAAPVVEAAPTEAPTAAPAPTDTPAPAPTEAPAATLRVWADDTRAPILQGLAADFQAEYGVELLVELKSAIRDDFQVAAPVGEGPDIIVIAHDQAGALAENGLLAPVDLGDMTDQFVANALAACTFNGELYCMPYATENMAFFYNTDLVETAPTTWDEVISVGEALMADGQTTYVMAATGSTYDMYPFFTSFGGYIFGKDASGNWDPQDLGVDNEGMIEAVGLLAELVAKGDIPADWDW
ncbi:MAG: extracellular solute-binding protein, partial [Caldilineaceae bacterium]|nr:extracellular solute-binding protein [Caldilineaceae bacterium]